jgi:spore germination protein KC
MLAGCWDRNELNELAITSATALDVDKGKWIMSYQVIIPSAISKAIGGSAGPSAQVPVVVYSTSGSTIKDAVANSYLEAPRKLYFAHNSIIVIGEAAARKGFGQLIDLYLRNPDSRETVSVLVASGDARSILEQLLNMDIIPGQGVQKIMEEEYQNLSWLPNTKMYDITMQMLGPSRCGLLPEIIISGGKEITGVDQLQKTTMTSKLRLGRAGIIKDEKLIGWLNQEEQLGAAFLSNNVNLTSIPFTSDGDPNSGYDSNFQLRKSNTSIEIKWADGKYELTAKIKARGHLNETNGSLNLIKPDVVKTMEKSIATEIEKDANKAWNAILKADADVVGFSDVIMRKYPKQWKALQEENESVLKKIKLTVKATATLDTVGLSNKSFNKLKED